MGKERNVLDEFQNKGDSNIFVFLEHVCRCASVKTLSFIQKKIKKKNEKTKSYLTHRMELGIRHL